MIGGTKASDCKVVFQANLFQYNLWNSHAYFSGTFQHWQLLGLCFLQLVRNIASHFQFTKLFQSCFSVQISQILVLPLVNAYSIRHRDYLENKVRRIYLPRSMALVRFFFFAEPVSAVPCAGLGWDWFRWLIQIDSWSSFAITTLLLLRSTEIPELHEQRMSSLPDFYQ